MGLNIAAALWGFAEATLFFVVPDVLLSAAGVARLRRGLVACGFALGGALADGALMYGWGRYDAAGALAVLDRLPAISPEMLAAVRDDLTRSGSGAILLGPLSGTPYKIYAVQSSAAGLGLVPLLLVSIPARLIRFVGVTLIAHVLLNRYRFAAWDYRSRLWLLLGAWGAFYAVYFSAMPN